MSKVNVYFNMTDLAIDVIKIHSNGVMDIPSGFVKNDNGIAIYNNIKEIVGKRLHPIMVVDFEVPEQSLDRLKEILTEHFPNLDPKTIIRQSYLKEYLKGSNPSGKFLMINHDKQDIINMLCKEFPSAYNLNIDDLDISEGKDYSMSRLLTLYRFINGGINDSDKV